MNVSNIINVSSIDIIPEQLKQGILNSKSDEIILAQIFGKQAADLILAYPK